MEPLTAAWFGDRLIYITDGGGRGPHAAGPQPQLSNRTSWLDAYVSFDGSHFEEASPFVVEEYWQPAGNCPPKSRTGCEQPVITFVTDADDRPIAVSYVRMDNGTGRQGGYTNWIYPFESSLPG